MVAKLVVVAGLFALVLAVFIVAAFRYIDRQAERAHERQMAREERDYETIMEYAEEDSLEARDTPDDVESQEHDPERE